MDPMRFYPETTEPPEPVPPTTSTTTKTNMVVVGILIGLICVLSTVLVILLARPIYDFIRRHLPENQKRKELRYRTIEGWVISKRVRHNDECTAYAMEHFVAKKSQSNMGSGGGNQTTTEGKIDPSSSYDTADTTPTTTSSFSVELSSSFSFDLDWKECPICMEEFQANDIVSWSPDDQASCQHFFHHECIKEWLLRSPHCPYCRETVIPIDAMARGKKVDHATLVTMSKRRALKFGTTFCSLDHGLVALTQPSMMTQQDKAMWETVLVANVQDEELVARRGGRQDNSEACTEKSVSTCHDMELTSIIISRGEGPHQRQNSCNTTTTVLTQAHRVPSNVRLADTEAGRALSPPDGSESPPPSCGYIQFGDELATSSVNTDRI